MAAYIRNPLGALVETQNSGEGLGSPKPGTKKERTEKKEESAGAGAGTTQSREVSGGGSVNRRTDRR